MTRDHETIDASLLAYLRDALDAPGLAFASPPKRFTAGVENRVYSLQLTGAAPALSAPLVLRLYGVGSERSRARLEAAVQASVAQQGFPVARPLHVCEDDAVLGAPFMIMERLPGQILLEPIASVRAGFWAPLRNWRGLLFQMPVVLADLMAWLHRLEPEPLRGALTDAGIDPQVLSAGEHLRAIRDRVAAGGLRGYNEALDWLDARRPPEPERLAICHGDFWFGNVLMQGGSVSGVLDWSSISVLIADPAYDVGITSVMLAAGMADLPGALRAIAARFQRGMSRRFLKRYRLQRPVTDDAVRYYQLVRAVDFLSYVAWRRLDPTLRARQERDLLDVPGSTEGLEAFFANTTGLRLPMPPRR
jgi:aminoglycoside phosphotransferase (APT) family kinase protein